jgi:hypothetical protein
MGWIIFGLFVVFVIGRMTGGAGNDKDDFAGNSVTSYFLLEEFIDKPTSEDETPDLITAFGDDVESTMFSFQS